MWSVAMMVCSWQPPHIRLSRKMIGDTHRATVVSSRRMAGGMEVNLNFKTRVPNSLSRRLPCAQPRSRRSIGRYGSIDSIGAVVLCNVNCNPACIWCPSSISLSLDRLVSRGYPSDRQARGPEDRSGRVANTLPSLHSWRAV